MRVGRWIIGGVLVAGAGLAAWRLLSPGTEAEVFLTVPARRGPISSAVAATGTVNPVITVQVGSQISGQLSALYADFNSVVRKDQVIARLDSSNLEAQVSRDRANLASTQANLERARVEADNARRAFQRAESLKAQALIPDSDFDAAESASAAAAASVKTAQAAVEQAKASLRISQVNLDHATILSPVDGIVISRNVDVGQTVAASLQAPTLFSIAQDLRKMQVHMNVAESDIGRLQLGQDATFTVDAYPQERFRGTIAEIRNSPTTIQNVVTYEAIISVNNDDLRLKPGMTANISVVVARRDDVLLVSNSALRFKPPEKYLTEKAAGPAAGGGEGRPPSAGAPGSTAGPAPGTGPSAGAAAGQPAAAGSAGSGAGQPPMPGVATGDESAPPAAPGGAAGTRSAPGARSGGSGRGSRRDGSPWAAPEAGGAGRRRAGGPGAGAPTDTPGGGAVPGTAPAAGGGAPTAGSTAPGGAPGSSMRPAGGGWSGGAGRMGPSVWILADGKPRRVPVTLGITDGSSTEIVSGELKDGDPVITELTPAAAAAQARTQRPGMGRMF